jgi:hypothetical protein
MRTPDGQEMWGRFIYREIVTPERGWTGTFEQFAEYLARA